MAQAYNQALKGWEEDEVPIGAVVVFEGQVIGQAHNQVESLRDPTAHAEILAISSAAVARGDWRLTGCTLYVTKEPCPQCSGATIMARLDRVVFAVPDPKMGCLGGVASLHTINSLNHHPTIEAGLMSDVCLEVLQAYFRLKRGGLRDAPGREDSWS